MTADRNAPSTADPLAIAHDARFRTFCQDPDTDWYAATTAEAYGVHPDNPIAAIGHAEALGYAGRFDEKLALLEAFTARHPGDVTAELSLGVEWMSRGEYARGWPYFSVRARDMAARDQQKALPPNRQWAGEALPGRTVLLVQEQGLGDTLQFARHAIWLRHQGAVPVMDAQRPLRPLLAASPALGAVPVGETSLAPHYWMRMMDPVPHVTPTYGDVTWPGAYIAPPASVSVLRALSAKPGLRVGLAWRGSDAFQFNNFRSVPLTALGPLADVPGCQFFGLMLPPVAEEIAGAGFTSWITDISTLAEPFERLAAVIAAMDVVVTVCTSIAHLAGAMGKPVILMLSAMPDWRWARAGTQQSSRTRWYPSMRLVRQTQLGDWAPVAAEVARRLQTL